MKFWNLLFKCRFVCAISTVHTLTIFAIRLRNSAAMSSSDIWQLIFHLPCISWTGTHTIEWFDFFDFWDVEGDVISRCLHTMFQQCSFHVHASKVSKSKSNSWSMEKSNHSFMHLYGRECWNESNLLTSLGINQTKIHSLSFSLSLINYWIFSSSLHEFHVLKYSSAPMRIIIAILLT